MPELTSAEREERRRGLGGSDAPAVFDLGYGSPFALWADKVWGATRRVSTQMQRGHDLEPLIASKTAERLDLALEPAAGRVVHPKRPWMAANIDYWTSNNRLVECKASMWQHKGHEWGPDGDPEGVPAHIELQVRHQLDVTGSRRGWVAVLFVDTWELRLYPIEVDQTITDLLIDGEQRFWHDHVLTREPPPVTDPNSALEALTRLPVTSDYVDLPEDEALEMITALGRVSEVRLEAEKEEKRLKAELGRLLGDAKEGRIAGETAVTFKAQTRGSTTYRRLHIPKRFLSEVLAA